jgi:phosphoketolase
MKGGGKLGNARAHAAVVGLDNPHAIVAGVIADDPGIHTAGILNAPFAGRRDGAS